MTKSLSRMYVHVEVVMVLKKKLKRMYVHAEVLMVLSRLLCYRMCSGPLHCYQRSL